MAGETVKTQAVCLGIRPWSRTSHIVSWLTPAGRVVTSVKGAVRPKSAFLGQYDLNYTCEIVYYARGSGDIHALRECVPLLRRDGLRADYRRLVLAEYFRQLAAALAPGGPECAEWLGLLAGALDALGDPSDETPNLARLLDFEMRTLALAGLSPELSGAALELRGERSIPVSGEVLVCLRDPLREKNLKILLDAARVIGVFYSFHVDCASDVRRTVLKVI